MHRHIGFDDVISLEDIDLKNRLFYNPDPLKLTQYALLLV